MVDRIPRPQWLGRSGRSICLRRRPKAIEGYRSPSRWREDRERPKFRPGLEGTSPLALSNDL
jgi:hypothetical protein